MESGLDHGTLFDPFSSGYVLLLLLNLNLKASKSRRGTRENERVEFRLVSGAVPAGLGVDSGLAYRSLCH